MTAAIVPQGGSISMKITGEIGAKTLSLNPNEILDRATVVEAFIHAGAAPRRAEDLADMFFYALQSLMTRKQEIMRKRKEHGKRLGLARAEQLRQQRIPKA